MQADPLADQSRRQVEALDELPEPVNHRHGGQSVPAVELQQGSDEGQR
jgi:hypothetical protein